MRLCFIFSVFSINYAYKFAVFNPLFAHSHTNFLGKIADTLTEAGHDVTMISLVLDQGLANKTGVKLTKKIVYFTQPAELKDMEKGRKEKMKNLWTTNNSPLSMFELFRYAALMAKVACRHIFTEKETMELLKKEKFDVAIIEPFTVCAYAYSQEIGIPTTIGALSVVHKDLISSIMGEPLVPSYVPSLVVPYSDQMTFVQRIKNSLAIFIGMKANQRVWNGEVEFLQKKLGDKFPGAEELIARSPVFFTNSNPYLNYPKPKIHKTVDIGGIIVDINKKYKLEEQWDKVLDERPHTVYISFGSMAASSDMPEEYKKSILSVCESLPDVSFIWKYEDTSHFPDKPKNLYLGSWLPQNALLADSRLSVFLSHGGLGSTTEIAYFGRPSIMARNAKMLLRHGGAILLEKADLGRPDVLKETIMEIINNKKYSESATRLAEMLKNAPFSPKDLVIKYAEFAAKFGEMPQLDPYGRHLSIVQYYNLDVLALVLVVLLLLLTVIFVIFRYVLRQFCQQKRKIE